MGRGHIGRLAAFAVLGAILLTILGCSSSTGTGGSGTGAPSGKVTLTDADLGKTAEVAKGGIVVVSLSGNPTTGYDWSVDGTLPPQLQEKGQASFTSDSPGVPGAGGTVTLQFAAVGAGSANLRLKYSRSFEKGTPPAKTWSATVVVK